VGPGPCVRVRAYLTPTFAAGERIALTLVAEDEYGNRDERFSGAVRIVNPLCGAGLPDTVPFRKGDRGVRRVRFAPRADLPSVRVACDCGGAGVLSSPAVRTARSFPYRLFFGELHAHTELSYDAAGSLDDLYAFARETAALDFAAASDHQTGIAGLSGTAGHGAADPLFDMAEMPARWEATRRAAARHRRPGRFETFVGSEWAPSGLPGHRNVYFLEDDPPQAKAPKGWTGETDLLNRFIRGRRVLVVPHHPAIAWNGRCDNPGPGMRYGDVPAAFQPVVEIASRHGSSECRGGRRPLRGEIPGFFVADMLAAGRRFGFIGGSDTHQADPGSTSEYSGPFSTLQYRSGLAAVWARELTRDALWEAIFARRTFATSGNRTVASFEVGGLFMGEEGRVAGPRRIVLKAWSGAGIVKVEILKNGAVIHAVNDHLVVPDMTIEYTDGERSGASVDYYYARVVETEGHVVWTSPVWAAA